MVGYFPSEKETKSKQKFKANKKKEENKEVFYRSSSESTININYKCDNNSIIIITIINSPLTSKKKRAYLPDMLNSVYKDFE